MPGGKMGKHINRDLNEEETQVASKHKKGRPVQRPRGYRNAA